MADTVTPARDARSFDPHEAEDAPPTAGAGLDLLLTEAGLGTRARFPPGGRPPARGAACPPSGPGGPSQLRVDRELAKVAAGRSANAPLINPEVLNGAIDTGGRIFVRGARQFARAG